jgi:hypothetical protein
MEIKDSEYYMKSQDEIYHYKLEYILIAFLL